MLQEETSWSEQKTWAWGLGGLMKGWMPLLCFKQKILTFALYFWHADLCHQDVVAL